MTVAQNVSRLHIRLQILVFFDCTRAHFNTATICIFMHIIFYLQNGHRGWHSRQQSHNQTFLRAIQHSIHRLTNITLCTSWKPPATYSMIFLPLKQNRSQLWWAFKKAHQVKWYLSCLRSRLPFSGWASHRYVLQQIKHHRRQLMKGRERPIINYHSSYPSTCKSGWSLPERGRF